MVTLDSYASAGFALELLAMSPYHRQQKLGDYFRAEILPAIWNNQIRFYLDDRGIPAAMVTWAWINEDIEHDIHETGRALIHAEWQSGDRMFINDWIAPYGNLRHYVRDMMDNVFPNVQQASSVRRDMNGSVRRINHWKRPAFKSTDQNVVSS